MESTRRCEESAGRWTGWGPSSSVLGVGMAALAVLLSGSASGLAAQSGDFEWSGALERGQTIEVFGVSGSVEAEAAGSGEARVRAEKRGRRSDPSDVRIEVVEHGGGVTICAVYPGWGNSCEPGDHDSRVRDNDVSVDFLVRVPAGVHFRGQTVNGEVRIRDLDGDVRASTVNGDVHVSTRGTAEARTVNGSVRASLGRSPTSPLEFETVNGSIELDLPEDTNADLEAEWVNGGMESDLPFYLVGRVSRRGAEGRLGDGGPLLRLSTVNGSIRIR